MKLDNIIESQKVTPIILGSSVNGYGLVRSFSEKKLYSILVCFENGPAYYSRYVYKIKCNRIPDFDSNLLNKLINLGKYLRSKSKKGTLFCTSDEFLMFIGKYGERLKDYFIIPSSGYETIERCLDKKRLYECAMKLGISCPITITINCIEEIKDIKSSLPYPCIVKPTITVGFTQKLGLQKKAIIVTSEDEMNNLINHINDRDLGNIPLVVQEVIPGDQKSLFTISAYTNADADILAYSIGYKIRQSPPDAGTITSGYVEHNIQVFELGKRILKGMKLHGISNTEFKLDSRDGKFKLIEINPRPGLWNYSATATGVNLPYECYVDIVGQHDGEIVSSEKTGTWCLDILDMVNAVYRNKKRGFISDHMSFFQWYKSIQQDTIYAIRNWKDPMPFLAHLYQIVHYVLFNSKENK